MATFASHDVESGTPGQLVWEQILGLLTNFESVEVVVKTNEGSNSFELRAWTGIRADGSNGPDATPGDDF